MDKEDKKEAAVSCLAYVVGLVIPGCVLSSLVVPILFMAVKDARMAGTRLLLPNSSLDSATAAISESPLAPVAYMAGTCAELQEKGLRNFFLGEPNYTVERDPDRNGLACEDR